MIRVLHVIDRVARGGGCRAMLTGARYTHGFDHAALSLLPPERAARALAQQAGVDVLFGEDAGRTAVAAADLVHVHFWNTPELYAWMRSDLPPARLVVTSHVAGEHPAQVLTPAVVESADELVLATALSLRLAPVRTRAGHVAVIPSPIEPSRLNRAAPPHAGFRVGYVGNVSWVKMHPRFVDLSTAARIESARFVVCGPGDAYGALRRRAAALGMAERFEWRGFIEDVGGAVGGLDVFGYPLRPDTFASSDLVVQEAMTMGVPPVVLDHGAVPLLVRHGETGLVVSEADYAGALELLDRDVDERRRLGANAREYARDHFAPERAGRRLAAVYARAMESPKRTRRLPEARLSAHRGADAFVGALGDAAPAFRTSLLAESDAAARAAEAEIAAASPVVTHATGGVLHYRRYFPADPVMRLWSGLVLAANRRPALAAAELSAASGLGLDCDRVKAYLREAMERAQ